MWNSLGPQPIRQKMAKFGCRMFFNFNILCVHILTLQVIFYGKIIELPTILTTNLAAVVCVCVCVCVRKIWPISALTLLFRIHTSRKFCSHSKIPIRCLWTTFCVPLSLIFYDKRWFRIQIVTVRRSRFAALWQIINSRNPFSRRGWMARGQRENVAECNDHGSNPVQGTIFCFHFYCLWLTRLTFNKS